MQEFFIIFIPAFLLGILHTLIPCEDKAIFFFWSFGISKDLKRSIYILILYGIGLISSNIIIAFVTVLISIVPRFIIPGLLSDPFTVNFFGAFTSMFAGIIILIFVMRYDYMPHSKYSKSIDKLDWERNKTPYLFGVLVGFAPCIFELMIYSQCLQFSLAHGFVEGVLIVFYFSLGTFTGLFPLALAKQGTAHVVRPKDSRRTQIFYAMLAIIIIFNTVVLVLSFLRIPVFPLQNI